MACSKCMKKVMKLAAQVEGINSVALDPSKGLVTVTGGADPVKLIRKMQKFRCSATFVSIGPAKEEKKEEKKDSSSVVPKTCHKCAEWRVIREEDLSFCNIL